MAFCLHSGQQSMFSGSTLFQNILDKQTPRPCSRPSESEILGVGPGILSFTGPLVDSDACPGLRVTDLV
jgi:hypothetical protein